MEFETIVSGETYHFTSLNPSSFLVSGAKREYILFKHSSNWRCPEEIDKLLLVKLVKAIEAHLQVAG